MLCRLFYLRPASLDKNETFLEFLPFRDHELLQAILTYGHSSEGNSIFYLKTNDLRIMQTLDRLYEYNNIRCDLVACDKVPVYRLLY